MVEALHHPSDGGHFDTSHLPNGTELTQVRAKFKNPHFVN